MKQGPRAWYGRINSFLASMEFTKSKVDPNIYLNVMNDEPDILLLYVDDLFLTRNEKQITTVILCDNQSCIKMTKNPMGYGTEGRYKTLVCEYR